MKSQNSKERILIHRIIYTLGILFVYMIGRSLPLYGVDVAAYRSTTVDAQSILVQNITGDYKNCSIFVLGMWPYMMGSMISMVYATIKSADKTTRLPQSKINRVILLTTMVIGFAQGMLKLMEFRFTKTFINIPVTMMLVMLQMLSGVAVILWLCTRNQKYGIGGRTVIFLVNIVESITLMIKGSKIEILWLPLLIGILTIPVMLFMETSELHIFVQRVSIHNIHAEKNYIAYKLNPAGYMPLMFTSVFYMLPQLAVEALTTGNPNNQTYKMIADNISLTSPAGVVFYLIIQTALTVCFAFLMLMPARTADNLMKGGDSILGIHAGRPTKKYLVKKVFQLSVSSALVLDVIIGVPMLLQFNGIIDRQLAMLPCTIMMLTGLWLSFSREATVYKHMEDYRPMI